MEVLIALSIPVAFWIGLLCGQPSRPIRSSSTREFEAIRNTAALKTEVAEARLRTIMMALNAETLSEVMSKAPPLFLQEAHDAFMAKQERAESGLTKEPIWSNAIVRILEARQKNPNRHPFTCGGPDGAIECERRKGTGEGVLIPTPEGWVCPCGAYKQTSI